MRSLRHIKLPAVKHILIKKITFGRFTNMKMENLQSQKMQRKA